MTSPSRFDQFRRDEEAISWWTILQILLLLIIPMGLLVFWLQYLRRIGADEAARDPFFGKKTMKADPQSTGDQKRVCSRCGLTVRPSRGSGPPICPNCMNVL